MKRRTFLCASAAALTAPALSVNAQTLPGSPIRMVVGFPPGGGTDAMARLLAQKLGTLWKNSIIVDNMPGAAGVIAAEYTAKQPSDGTTLLMANFSSHTIAPALYPHLTYNVQRDFVPIVLVGVTPTVLIAGPRQKQARTLQDVITLCKNNPNQITFGSSGPGSIQHMALEMFKLRAGVQAIHVPYKGSGPMMTDLLGGHIDFSFDTVPSAFPQISHGLVRGLAQTNEARSPLLPNIPTVAESGFPGFQVVVWYGLLGPGKLPQAMAERMNRDVDTVLAMPDVAKAMEGYGAENGGGTAAQFAAFMTSEAAKWSQVIKDAKITI